MLEEMALKYPGLAQLQELRAILSKLRQIAFTVGQDGRNRLMLGQFGSDTGRNQPASAKYIFGAASWLRGLIKPPEGFGLAYLDYRSQEFAIAAALSKDPQMIEDYLSGDPYLRLAVAAGAVPKDATKETHPNERDLYKTAVLAINYGQSAFGLAQRLGITKAILRAHQDRYPVFWRWVNQVVAHAPYGRLHTALGWPIQYKGEINPRAVLNFPMQGNGAEILRLACCLGTEAGISICAPVHDAVVIEAPLDRLEEDIAAMQTCMRKAASVVLSGFEIDVDAKIVRHSDRFMDEKRGAEMWAKVMALLSEIESG